MVLVHGCAYTQRGAGDGETVLVAQVFLGPNGEVEEYAVVPVQPNTPINSDLILDQKEENLFIMTSTMVRRDTYTHARTHTHLHAFTHARIHTQKHGHPLSHQNKYMRERTAAHAHKHKIDITAFCPHAAPEEARSRVPETHRLPFLPAGSRPLLRLVCSGGQVGSVRRLRQNALWSNLVSEMVEMGAWCTGGVIQTVASDITCSYLLATFSQRVDRDTHYGLLLLCPRTRVVD